MNKADLRKVFLKKRKTLDSGDVQELQQALVGNFKQVRLQNVRTVMSFYAMEKMGEIDMKGIESCLRSQFSDVSFCYPKVINTTDMQAVVAGEDTPFFYNKFGTKELGGRDYVSPHVIDLVLVPLLAFDKSGGRVGYGKGYYDNFLKKCRLDCFKLGWSFFDPVERIEDIHKNDIPLDACVTPSQLYYFS